MSYFISYVDIEDYVLRVDQISYVSRIFDTKEWDVDYHSHGEIRFSIDIMLTSGRYLQIQRGSELDVEKIRLKILDKLYITD